MFIIYSSQDEAIVCTPETEPETLDLFFKEGGRDLDDYDRETATTCAVSFRTRLTVE